MLLSALEQPVRDRPIEPPDERPVFGLDVAEQTVANPPAADLQATPQPPAL
jgi:hypothetical protein